MVVIVQHPGEEPYVEVSQTDNGRAALSNAPQMKEALIVEPPIEGAVETVTNSDFKEVKQLQPQEKKQKGSHGIPYGLNNAMITYQLESREGKCTHEILDVQPKMTTRRGLHWKLILTQEFRRLR